MTIDRDFLHCPGLEHVITDTHFSARSRLGRLIAFVARINHDDPAAKVYGIGVDEASALLIVENGIGRLAPGSKGSVWIVEEPNLARSRIEAGTPLTIDNVRIARVDAGSTLDLATRHVAPARESFDLSIRGGAGDPMSPLLHMLSRIATPDGES
jgi:beta-aspartyl-peptidase (threonine type)